MSGKERGLRLFAAGVLGVIALVIFGPWLLLVTAAWLLEPRTGSWGAWPHLIGAIWALGVVTFMFYGRLR